MTGYGRGEASNGKITIAVELKTLNNRFRDVQLRVPKPYMCLEPRIRKTLSNAIHRGRIEVHVRRESIDSAMDLVADPILAERCYRQISSIAQRLQMDPAKINLSDILTQPGVIQTVDRTPDALNEWTLVETALEMALIELSEMRQKEGQALQKAMLDLMNEVRQTHAKINAEIEDVNAWLFKKLEARLLRFIGDRIEPNRLAQEAAILVDKSDISEELIRLESHCNQMAELLDADGAVGRKIEFLLQELNREINTIGSKAAHHSLSVHVVSLKSVLEKIREQAANIE